jgi:hypothetical protein
VAFTVFQENIQFEEGRGERRIYGDQTERGGGLCRPGQGTGREEASVTPCRRRCVDNGVAVKISQSGQLSTAGATLFSGLVIVEAVYGVLDNAQAGPDEPPATIDVRIALQSLVNNDNTLVVPGGRTKARLLGFWDPALGSRKQLRVRYLFKRRMHSVVVDDKSPLSIPVQGEKESMDG